MTLLMSIFARLSGYRTYLAAAATILTAIATAAGMLCPESGVALGATCLALAAICQRLATAKTVDDVLAALQELERQRAPKLNLFHPDSPPVLKFPENSTMSLQERKRQQDAMAAQQAAGATPARPDPPGHEIED